MNLLKEVWKKKIREIGKAARNGLMCYGLGSLTAYLQTFAPEEMMMPKNYSLDSALTYTLVSWYFLSARKGHSYDTIGATIVFLPKVGLDIAQYVFNGNRDGLANDCIIGQAIFFGRLLEWGDRQWSGKPSNKKLDEP